jgi:hypothetical protein
LFCRPGTPAFAARLNDRVTGVLQDRDNLAIRNPKSIPGSL